MLMCKLLQYFTARNKWLNKNVYLNVDGCAYRGPEGTTHIIHISLSMEDGSPLESGVRWDGLVAEPKAIRL